MSSILKALKKVETENASRRHDEIRIDAEILRTDGHSRFSSSAMLLVSLLLMAFGAGSTYLYMNRDKKPERTGLNASVLPGKKQVAVSATAEIKTEQLPPDIIVVPAQRQSGSEGVGEAKQLPVRQVTGAPRDAGRPGAAPRRVVTPQLSAPLPAPQTNNAVPAVRVNGIAFQDDNAASVAMINGEPLLRGGIIAGVKVEEIYKNRVKFSYNGNIFEVPMGQSNR